MTVIRSLIGHEEMMEISVSLSNMSNKFNSLANHKIVLDKGASRIIYLNRNLGVYKPQYEFLFSKK